MEFSEGKCPKCNGVLQIPSDRDKIICMYCGEEIAAQDALNQADGEVKPSSDEIRDYVKNRERAMEELVQMLRVSDVLQDFKRDKYEESFYSYYKRYRNLLEIVESAYRASKEKEKLIREIAESFVTAVCTELEEIPKKGAKDQKLMDYNMCMAVYVFPAMLEYKGQSSEPLTDELVEAWRNTFPKYQISKADFQKINSGFRKKLCYITTAVCESLGKADDCYELNLLREFRDHYLMKQKNGASIVHEYYDIAPTIVKRMNQKEDCAKLYQDVWKNYLEPCVNLIENGKQKECMDIYADMVLELQKRYILNQCFCGDKINRRRQEDEQRV